MPGSYLHILILDDNARRAARLARPFAGWGWAATILDGDTTQALAYLAENAVDLILLDIAAAEKDGYALLHHLQAQDAEHQVPVVITLPAGTATSRLVAAVENGATDTTARATQPALLRARLLNVVQKKLLRDQADAALQSFNEIEKIADDLRLVILPLGAALSSELDYDRLVGQIVEEALSICHADAGVLLLAGPDDQLHYTNVHIKSLNLTYGGPSTETDQLLPLPLTDPETGVPNLTSIGTYVATTGETLNLTDIHNSQRFNSIQLQAFEDAHVYTAHTCLAVPLRNGQVVGSLLLFNSIDPVTGVIVPFDAYHQQVAESLASQAAVVLNNRLLNEQQAALMRLKRELEIGREIQLSFLPESIPELEGWEVATRFWPALEVAGDFYDLIELPHGHLGFVLADVVGKGVTAALFMAIIRSLYRALFQQYYLNVGSGTPVVDRARVGQTSEQAPLSMTPFSFIDREALLNAVQLTNAYLINNHGGSYMFATLFAGLLHPVTGRLLYVNAGHMPPYILGPNSATGRPIQARLPTTGPAIGLLPNQRYAVAETVMLPGQLLYAFTDGVTDARNPNGEEFGTHRLENILLGPSQSAESLLSQLQQAMDEFAAGAVAYDDITELALRRIDAP